MPDPETPIFRWPMSWDGARPKLIEQDSREDITQCAENTVRTPLGFRPEEPGFGLEDMAFDVGPDEQAVADAIEDADERAVVLAEQEPDQFDTMVTRIITRVQGRIA